MGTIRFELRNEANKIDKAGRSPIRLVYQVKGQRKYYNTGQKVISLNWDPETQRAVYRSMKEAKELGYKLKPIDLPTDSELKEVNSELLKLISNVEEIEKRFELDKIPYSSMMVVDKLKEIKTPVTKKEIKTNFLYEFLDQYIEDHKASRVEGSLEVYRSLKRHLQGYEKENGIQVRFDKMDVSFFQSFQDYLIKLPVRTKDGKIKYDQDGKIIFKLRNTTIAKQLSTVKTFLTYARKRDIPVSEKYRDFPIKKEDGEVIHLTSEELDSLLEMDLKKNKRLDAVRDIFCFSCATGLRYSDLDQLRWEHIKGDEIKINVRKTKQILTVPLNPVSQAILEKYQKKESPRPLPMLSNQKLNDYIKELCKMAEIDEPIEKVRFRGRERIAEVFKKYDLISIHTGRRTFCTLSLEKGMSAEEVMSISGHKDYASFKRYVKVTEKRKKVVMEKAWGRTDRLIMRLVRV